MNERDPRWRDLAGILAGHATGVQPGDRVLVAMREVETLPLATAVVERAARLGARPQAIFTTAAFDRVVLFHGDDALAGWEPELEAMAYDWADVAIVLRGARNPHELAGIPAAKVALHRRALGAISARRTASTRWTLVRVPTRSMAQAAGMPFDAVMDVFWASTLRDWSSEAAGWQALANRLDAGSRVRISGPGIDLAFSTTGRRWVVGDGRINVPDGEVYTAPVDDSAEGEVEFDWPSTTFGQPIEGIRLRFRRGAVVEATADRNEAALLALLAMDDGARRIGEVGIGVNRGLVHPLGDVLFDEKMFGTVHLALGRAYAECGGVNQSALHWDLVKDLRSGGRIDVDGWAVFADGAFVG